MLDVSSAWKCGELDGYLPSGAESRVKTSERMLSLSRALELFEEGKINVRRRYRNIQPDELRPRWNRIVETRATLQAEKRWDFAVSESEKVRNFQKTVVVEGGVESEDASPGYARAVATLLSPALKAAAATRNRADGGYERAFAELQSTAGVDAAERWLTSALLADFENEAASIPPATPVAPTSKFVAAEAERDVEQATSFGIVGVGLALVSGYFLLKATYTGDAVDLADPGSLDQLFR